MRFEELEVYQMAMDMAEKIWDLIGDWDYFARDTIGKQLMKSVDSVAANLSEGFGRYFYKENKQFCYYSRGSLCETKTWLTKAFTRNLLREDDYCTFIKDIDIIGIKINNYINSIGHKARKETDHK